MKIQQSVRAEQSKFMLEFITMMRMETPVIATSLIRCRKTFLLSFCLAAALASHLASQPDPQFRSTSLVAAPAPKKKSMLLWIIVAIVAGVVLLAIIAAVIAVIIIKKKKSGYQGGLTFNINYLLDALISEL